MMPSEDSTTTATTATTICDDDDVAAPDVLVLLATQSFTGEALVDDVLLDRIHAANLTVQVKFVDEVFSVDHGDQQEQEGTSIDTESLYYKFWPSNSTCTQRRPNLAVLIVCSTYGDGDPPNHAVSFADWLLIQRQHHHNDHNENVPPPFAVFGLGDSSYAHFAAFGEYVDGIMHDYLGATRLLPLTTGDKQGNQLCQFEQWSYQIVGLLRGRCDLLQFKRSPSRPLSMQQPFPKGTGMDIRRSAIQPDSVVASVVAVEELIKRDQSKSPSRSVVHVTLSIPSTLTLPLDDLQPGDHVGVYPRNDESVVRKALHWLGVEESMSTKVLEKKDHQQWLPREISAYEFLSEHVDLAGRASPAVLRALLPFVGTLELRALARELTHVETNVSSTERMETDDYLSAFDEWLAGRRLTALDLAIMFECRPSIQAFARACGALQPRLYSVATTATEDSTMMVGLCVAVAEGGLCSNYMANLGDGQELRAFFQKSRYRFVVDGALALLIAAGSGVGTCIGFMERELQRMNPNGTSTAPLSHMHLFFGCRTPAELLYEERISAFVEHGLHLYPAFSRVPGCAKTYVQELVRRNAAAVWKMLSTERGTIYICGRLELLAGVRAALVDVAKSAGGLNDQAAERFMHQLEQSSKWKTDCWSVEGGDATASHSLHRAKARLPRPHVVLRLERHHAPSKQPNSSSRVTNIAAVPSWPSYLRLMASGELERRVQRATDMYSACVACGRTCETERLSSDSKDWGECRVGERALVASAFAHFGEESCLVGEKGSGTIFFAACNLKCMYCQNWELSAMDEGQVYDDTQLADTMLSLQKRGCHNINFVSPTHNLLAILRAVLIAAQKGLHLPLVWNTGGYDSVVALRLLDGVVDIYMPDSKYASRTVARKLSKVDNYPEINQAAIKEMHRQVGNLQLDPQTGLARRGVLVRHLILPCHLAGTCDVMGFLAKEVSEDTYANVMDQYRPEHLAIKDKKYGIRRKPTRKELREGHDEAKQSGLKRFDQNW